jgi:REP element-mobilizing transposase RayT
MSQEKYVYKLTAVEIVGNHFHLGIIPLQDEAPVSLIMQYIKARTAEKFNRATGRKGPFWNERYGCSIVDESDNPETYTPWLTWYIAYNPVRAGLSHDPRDNYIGFINCYLKEDYELPVPIKITLHPYFMSLGDTFSERMEKFLLYEEAYRKRLAIYF